MRIVECGLYGMATMTVMAIIVISLSECEIVPDCINCIDDPSKAAYHDEIA